MDHFLTLKVKQLIAAAILTFPIFTIEAAESRVIWLLSIAVLADSLLGVATAIKHKRFSSWKMGQPMARKVTLYSFALIGAFIASETHPYLFWALEYVGVYFVLSEVLSIFEKLSLWGLQLPTRLLSSVNILFERYRTGDAVAEDRIVQKN